MGYAASRSVFLIHSHSLKTSFQVLKASECEGNGFSGFPDSKAAFAFFSIFSRGMIGSVTFISVLSRLDASVEVQIASAVEDESERDSTDEPHAYDLKEGVH
jgi:hypothetical protein